MVGAAAVTIAQQARGLSSLQKTTDRSRATGAELERGQEPTKNESELSNELEQTRAKLADRDRALIHANQWIEYLAERGADLEQQVAREASAPQILRDQVEALATQSAAADNRIAELERE